jgi:Flp pilus assembly protein TadB
MKGLTTILVVVAIAIGIWFIITLTNLLGLPPGVAIGVGIAFGAFATIYIVKFIKDML